MPLVTTSLATGRLGLLVPPMPPLGSPHDAGPTLGTTKNPTFGSTAWVNEIASGAEHAGATGIWATDHLFWRRPGGECLTTLAVAATATHAAALGTCVLQLPLRGPAAVAKQASALQVLSGGRFVLGVGVGSHPGEYDLAGSPFHTRGKDLDAGIAALRTAWETAVGSGAYRLEPAPPVPVWVGGSSPAAIRRAATAGDGWVPLFVGPERFGALLGQLREAVVEAGRHPGDVPAAVVMVATVGRDTARAAAAGAAWLAALYGIPAKAFDRHLVAGPPEHCAETAARYVAAGAAHVIVFVAGDDALAQFRALAAAYDRLGIPGGPAVDPTHDMAGVGA